MPSLFIDLIKEVETQLRVSPDERDKVRRWVNWAQRQVARAHPWTFLERHVRAPTTTDNPNIYTLPQDFILPRTVRIENAAGDFSILGVIPIETERINHPKHTDQGTPERCVFSGRTLILRPGSKVDTSFIHLDYLRTPPDLVGDSNVPLIPDVYRDALVTGATWTGSRWLFQDKGDQDRYKAMFKESIFDILTGEKGEGPQNNSVLNGLDPDWQRLVMDA